MTMGYKVLWIRSPETFRYSELLAFVGFPGMGLVGKISVDFIAKKLGAQRIGRIYTPSYPAHLLVTHGEGDILSVDFLFSSVREDRGVIVVTGNMQPGEDREMHELSLAIVSELERVGVSEVISAAAFVDEVDLASEAPRRVYVVGSDRNYLKKFVDAGAEILNEGVISGINGIIVGWAKVLGLKSACVLGETARSLVEINYADYRAAAHVVKLLDSVYRLGIEGVDELIEMARSVEREAVTLASRAVKPEESYKEKGDQRTTYYIT